MHKIVNSLIFWALFFVFSKMGRTEELFEELMNVEVELHDVQGKLSILFFHLFFLFTSSFSFIFVRQ